MSETNVPSSKVVVRNVRFSYVHVFEKDDFNRWGVGAQAGYGITPAGFQPYLGVGVSFNLFSW